jgi:hypothetical protein
MRGESSAGVGDPAEALRIAAAAQLVVMGALAPQVGQPEAGSIV